MDEKALELLGLTAEDFAPKQKEQTEQDEIAELKEALTALLEGKVE